MFKALFKNYSLAFKKLPHPNILYTHRVYFGNSKGNKLSLFNPSKSQLASNQLYDAGNDMQGFINFKEFFSNAELKEQDIQNFDLFYRERKSIRVKGRSKKNILSTSYTYNINEILELKLSDDYEKILYFLRVRGKMLKDAEIFYIFKVLSETKMLKKFQKEEAILFAELCTRASEVAYSEMSTALNLLQILRAEKIFHPLMIRQLYKFYLVRLNEIEEPEPEDIIEGLRLLETKEIYSVLDVPTMVEIITLEFFDHLYKFPQVYEFLLIMSNIGQVSHLKFVVCFEKYLVECIPHITLEDFIQVFYILVKNEVKESIIYHHVEDVLRQKFKGITAEKPQAGLIPLGLFGKFCWAISQAPAVTENEKLWEKLEEITLDFVEEELKNQHHLNKMDISVILQAFNKANQGTHMFWSFKFEDIVLKGRGTSPYEYNDLIVIFYNRISRKIYYSEFFKHILEFEKDFKMAFLQNLPFNQFHLTIYTYSVGIDLYSSYLEQAKDEELIEGQKEDFYEFLDIASDEINGYLQRLSPEELKASSLEDFMDIYVALTKLAEQGLITLDEESITKLNQEMSTQYKGYSFGSLLKLGITISDYTEDLLEGLNYKKIFGFLGDTLQKALLIEVLDLLPNFIQFNVENEYLWAILDMKLIESIESLNANDLIIVGIVFQILNRGPEEFWELYYDTLRECIHNADGTIVEDGKKVFGGNEEMMEILNSFKVPEQDELGEERSEYFTKYDQIKFHLLNMKEEGESSSLINELILEDV